MPLFSRTPETTTAQTTHIDEKPKRTSTLFGRKRSISPARTSTTHHSHTTTSTSPKHTGLLHRSHEDPSIVAARERVMNAEAKEREADKALASARVAVREAREHIKFLEREAKEEARLAKIKQDQANKMSKRGHALGRHENH